MATIALPSDVGHERPMIFSAPSINAMVAGVKSQTRRIVNLDSLRVRLPDAINNTHDDPGIILPRSMRRRVRAGLYRARLNQHGAVTIATTPKGSFDLGVKPGEFHFVCPYASGETVLEKRGARNDWAVVPHIGQRLWVREQWRTHERPEDLVDGIQYAADNAFVPIQNTSEAADRWVLAHDNGRHGPGWRTPLYMPRWACRFTLLVMRVRIGRLQSITEEDAWAEGVRPFFERFPEIDRDHRLPCGDLARTRPYCASYAVSWDELNADRGSWKSDPWCWSITFAVERS